jgi:hypothetical protein
VELNPGTITLLDDAFDSTYNSVQARREVHRSFRDGALAAVAAMTGQSEEDLYERFRDKMIARHEANSAREV